MAIGTITNSGNTYTFSPTANLSGNTTYYVVLGSGITNSNGTALSGTTQFSFTTKNGESAYIVNYSSGNISLCSVNTSTGALSGCTTSSGVTGLSAPKGMTISNGYAYVASGAASGSVTACVINL